MCPHWDTLAVLRHGNKQTVLKVNTKPGGDRVGRGINDFPPVPLTSTGTAEGMDVSKYAINTGWLTVEKQETC